jgi:hypothetical protein
MGSGASSLEHMSDRKLKSITFLKIHNSTILNGSTGATIQTKIYRSFEQLGSVDDWVDKEGFASVCQNLGINLREPKLTHLFNRLDIQVL